MEIWKDISGYEGLYEVSSLGRVKRIRFINKQTNKMKESINKPKIKKDGYLYVDLYKNGKGKSFAIHRLVAKAFIPNPENKSMVKHLADKKDNRPENLEWYDYDEIVTKYKRIAKKNGIRSAVYHDRRYRGWALDEAATIPLLKASKGPLPRVYSYYGKWETVAQLSKIAKVQKRIIYKRLKSGWNIYEAVEIPPQGRKDIGNEF